MRVEEKGKLYNHNVMSHNLSQCDSYFARASELIALQTVNRVTRYHYKRISETESEECIAVLKIFSLYKYTGHSVPTSKMSVP